MHSAAVLAASGHGDVKAARALIRKRARELGVDVSALPGFSDGSVAAAQRDEDDADLEHQEIAARNPHVRFDNSKLFRPRPRPARPQEPEPRGRRVQATAAEQDEILRLSAIDLSAPLRPASSAIADAAREGGQPVPGWSRAVVPDEVVLAHAMGRTAGEDDPEALALARSSGVLIAPRQGDRPPYPGSGPAPAYGEARADMSGPDEIAARHPQFFGPGGRGKARAGRKVTTRTRAHASDLQEAPSDTRQPSRGGEVHPDVRRLIEANPDLFSDGTGRNGTANRTIRPLSRAERTVQERRARTGPHGGHTNGGGWADSQP